jgi:hypothetical protein
LRVEASRLTASAVSEPPARAPLSVGVIVDSLQPPRWVHDVIANLLNSSCRVSLVVLDQGPTGPAGSPTRIATLLYEWYTVIDKWLFRVPRDPSEPTSIESLVASCPVWLINGRPSPQSAGLDPDDAEAIRRYNLDVLVHLGSRALHAGAAAIATHGIWRYCHGGINASEQRGPAGFAEVMNGNSVTASAILALVPQEPRHQFVVQQSFVRTHKNSVSRNRFHYYKKSASLMARSLRTLHEVGSETIVEAGIAPAPPASGSVEQGGPAPTNSDMLVSILKTARRALRSRVTRLRGRDQWFVAFQFSSDARSLWPLWRGELAPHQLTAILPPQDRFWADPFPVSKGNRHYAFVEEYVYGWRRGHIAVLEVHEDGTWSTPVPVLERPFHLSYPFVFEWRGNYFMCPESSANGSIDLYRARRFPYEWELEVTLLDAVRAVDPTLVQIEDRWWMFANIAQPDANDPSYFDDELHLFHASSPLGPWTPHKRNPVKRDVRSARPAGRLFNAGGSLFRPSQDCSVRYGYAIALNRIERIDPEAYEESTVSRLLPTWSSGLLCTHTINSSGNLTVVDGKVRRRRRTPKPSRSSEARA